MKSYVVHVTEKSTQRYLVEAEDAAEARQAVVEGGGLRMFPIQNGEIQLEGAGDWVVKELEPEARSVDLKWSLWSQDKDFWEEKAPGVWGQLEKLRAGESITITTEPRKEIRYGRVTIERTEAGYDADVHFQAVWDSAESLCDTVGLGEENLDAVRELLPYANGEAGVEIETTLTGVADLLTLMVAIDDVEDELLVEDKQAWVAFEKACESLKGGVEEEICGACSGTGEGWNETVNCSTCNGTGVEPRKNECQD
jgi:hypothetical protein